MENNINSQGPDLSSISEDDVVKLVEAFRAEGLPDKEIFRRAVVAASKKALDASSTRTDELCRRLSIKENELKTAMRSSNQIGFVRVAFTIAAGLVIGGVIGILSGKVVWSDEKDRNALRTQLNDARSSIVDLQSQVHRLAEDKTSSSNILVGLECANTNYLANIIALSNQVYCLKRELELKTTKEKSNVGCRTSADADNRLRELKAEISRLKEDNEKLSSKCSRATQLEAMYIRAHAEATNKVAELQLSLNSTKAALDKLRGASVLRDPAGKKDWINELDSREKNLDRREKKIVEDEKSLKKDRELFLEEKQNLAGLQAAVKNRQASLSEYEQTVNQREIAVEEKESGLESKYRKLEAKLRDEYETRRNELDKHYQKKFKELESAKRK
jgi:chromosome segregation ATPase